MAIRPSARGTASSAKRMLWRRWPGVARHGSFTHATTIHAQPRKVRVRPALHRCTTCDGRREQARAARRRTGSSPRHRRRGAPQSARPLTARASVNLYLRARHRNKRRARRPSNDARRCPRGPRSEMNRNKESEAPCRYDAVARPLAAPCPSPAPVLPRSCPSPAPVLPRCVPRPKPSRAMYRGELTAPPPADPSPKAPACRGLPRGPLAPA